MQIAKLEFDFDAIDFDEIQEIVVAAVTEDFITNYEEHILLITPEHLPLLTKVLDDATIGAYSTKLIEI